MENLTRDEHTIPQVYLRGFSCEYIDIRDDARKDHTIFFHRFGKEKQVERAVPVKDICKKRDAYEVYDSEGNIVLQNHLERFFGVFEKKYGKYRTELEKKVFYEENYKIKNFLKNEEKNFWAAYMIIQILRLPQTLGLAEDLSLEMFNEIGKREAENIARLLVLPFFKDIQIDDKELQLFNALLIPMSNMYWGVGVDKTERLITSDNPVFIARDDDIDGEYTRIIFPLTSKICLMLFGNEYKRSVPKNFLFPINDEIREEINCCMAIKAFEQVFSNRKLSKMEIMQMEQMRLVDG